MSPKVTEKCVCALKTHFCSLYIGGVAVLSATNRVTHHVWVDTKTHLHTMINTQTQRAVMRPVVSHHLMMSPSMSISEVQFNKTPCRRVLTPLKWKSFLLCISVRRTDLMTPVNSWRLSSFSVIWCGQTIKKLITVQHSQQRSNLNGCSHCFAGRHRCDLKLHWQQITWHHSMNLNKVTCAWGNERAMQHSAFITIFDHDNCPSLLRKKAETVHRMAMYAIMKTPYNVFHLNITSRESVQQNDVM